MVSSWSATHLRQHGRKVGGTEVRPLAKGFLVHCSISPHDHINKRISPMKGLIILRVCLRLSLQESFPPTFSGEFPTHCTQYDFTKTHIQIGQRLLANRLHSSPRHFCFDCSGGGSATSARASTKHLWRSVWRSPPSRRLGVAVTR